MVLERGRIIDIITIKLEIAVKALDEISNLALGGLDFTSDKKFTRMVTDNAFKISRKALAQIQVGSEPK